MFDRLTSVGLFTQDDARNRYIHGDGMGFSLDCVGEIEGANGFHVNAVVYDQEIIDSLADITIPKPDTPKRDFA